MNDGWFDRALDRIGGVVAFVWFGVFWGLGVWFDVRLLMVVGALPFILLISWVLVTNTVEWWDVTSKYIRDGEDGER